MRINPLKPDSLEFTTKSNVEQDFVSISLVVVTYNSEKVLGKCLRELGENHRVEVIIVDNNSSDGSVEIAEASNIVGRILVMERNLGFAKAVNIGVDARSTSSKWIILLNPDAEVKADDLVKMISVVGQDPSVGVISPMIRDPQGRLRIMPYGREPTVWRMLCHYSGLSRLSRRYRMFEGFHALFEDREEVRAVDWVTGACMAVRVEVWESLNGLSDRWFMYAEDIEFCHRVRMAGWAVVWDPSTNAVHRAGTSTTGKELSFDSAWIENLFDYYRTDLNSFGAGLLAWKTVVALGLLSRAGVFWICGIVRAHDDEIEWGREAKRFAHFARSVMSVKR